MSAGRAGYDAMVALEQDAARYRWLRDEVTANGADVYDLLADGYAMTPESFDEAIDYAMDPLYTITPAGREHLDGKA